MVGNKEQGGLPIPELSLEKVRSWCEVGHHKERDKYSTFAMNVSKVHTLVVRSLKYISHKSIASPGG